MLGPGSTTMRIEAFVVATLVRALLAVMPLHHAARLLTILRYLPSRCSAAFVMDAADTACARVSHPTCLYRSLTVFAMLQRRRLDARLMIGASISDGFAAHAWVDPMHRTETQRYTVVWTYPTRV